MTTEPQTLKLDQIRIDGGTQPRVAIDEQVVAEYAELYGSGFNLPPVTVFYDGANYWLADGFHRYWANKKIDCESVFADLHQGTQRDAILYSVGANASHGLRRTNEDKRKAILLLLEDEEWSKWSDREIARRCGVNKSTVSRIRESSLAQSASEKFFEKNEAASSPGQNANNSPPTQPRTYKTKHGTVARMKTGKIGRPATSQKSTSQSPGFAQNAYRPKASHSEHGPVPMRTVSLPLNNPQLAARCMISLYGESYMQQLAEEINRIISHTEGTVHDCNPHQ